MLKKSTYFLLLLQTETQFQDFIAFILHHLCNYELRSMQLLVPSEHWVSKVSNTFTPQIDKNEKGSILKGLWQ